MTEYDYSPEAYNRHMATQQRISNWVDSVSQSMSAPTTPSSSDHQQYRSRPPYTRPPSHSQHSRSNSASRSHSREPQFYHREPMRQRSHSHSSSRPHPVRSHSYAQPVHSRTYSYAVNLPPPPVPIPVPPPVPLHHPVPSRSRTLPPPGHNIIYHTYDAPHGGPTYVIVPPAYGGGPPQVRMHSAVTPSKRSQPLLKRLFTSFGPWGSSSSAHSPKAKLPPSRRHRRRSSL